MLFGHSRLIQAGCGCVPTPCPWQGGSSARCVPAELLGWGEAAPAALSQGSTSFPSTRVQHVSVMDPVCCVLEWEF